MIELTQAPEHQQDRRAFLASAATAAIGAISAPGAARASANPGAYAHVNGLSMYFETHGEGAPLVLLHGGFETGSSAFASVIAPLAETRRLIIPDLQAHGRTADINRPIRYEFLADDIAALIEHLGYDRVDVIGSSLGAGAGLQLALRHPERVGKLVFVSGSYSLDGIYPQILAQIGSLSVQALAGSPYEREYAQTAPHPQNWSRLIEKVKDLDAQPYHVPEALLRGLRAPLLIVVGDADIIMPEHAVALYRLRGGGLSFDTVNSQTRLAVLPATSHIEVMSRTAMLMAIIPPFLSA